MHKNNELGIDLAERRNILGITQIQLSEVSGVSLSSIIQIEKGIGNPSIKTLNKILDILGLELNIKLKKQ